jgi:hypothetical protein
MSLLEHCLVFMRRGSPSESAPVISRICKIPLSRTPTTEQVKKYLDAVTPEIEQFLKAAAPVAN